MSGIDSVSVRLSVCPFVRLSVCPFVRLSVCPFVHLSVRLYACVSICMSVCVGVCQSVCLCLCVSLRLSNSVSVCVFNCQTVFLSVRRFALTRKDYRVRYSSGPTLYLRFTSCIVELFSVLLSYFLYCGAAGLGAACVGGGIAFTGAVGEAGAAEAGFRALVSLSACCFVKKIDSREKFTTFSMRCKCATPVRNRENDGGDKDEE